MAKFCDQCKQPYPDNEKSCPRCAAGSDSDDIRADMGNPQPKPAGWTPSDSDIDLGQFASPSKSSMSVQGSGRPKAGKSGAKDKDSSSVDLIGPTPDDDLPPSHLRLVGDEEESSSVDYVPKKPKKQTQVQPPAPATNQPDSSVDLAAKAPASPWGSSSGLHLDEVSDAGGDARSSSGMELQEVESESDIFKAAKAEAGDQGSSSGLNLDMLEAESGDSAKPRRSLPSSDSSGLDLEMPGEEPGDSQTVMPGAASQQPPGLLPTLKDDDSSMNLLEEFQTMESGSAVNLGRPPASGSSDRLSSIHEPSPESPGSGVDLFGTSDRPPSSSRQGARHESPLEEVLDDDDPSAVNLGTPAQQSLPPSGSDEDETGEAPPTRPGRPKRTTDLVTAAARNVAAEGVDVAGTAGRGHDEADEVVGTAELEEDEAAPRPPRPAAPSSRGWLGAGAVGVLAGAAACLGLWMAGVEPPEALRLAGKKADQTQPPGPRMAQGLLSQDGNNLGDAGWLAYLRNKPDAKVKEDDEEFTRALFELEKNKENDAMALFWFGHVYEVRGQTEKARETYREGLTKFPTKKPLFDSALIRLDLPRPASGRQDSKPLGMHNHDDLRELVLLVTALQATGGAADAPEAGTVFWQAVKLAQNPATLSKALEALDEARRIHDKERYSRLGKGQNPLSDPTEEVFLRCCEELRNSWQLRQHLYANRPEAANKLAPIQLLDSVIGREKELVGVRNALNKAGYNVTAKLTADKAVGNLITDKTNTEQEAKKLKDSLASVTDLLMKEKIIADPKELTTGLTKLLAMRGDDTKVKELEAKLATAQKDKDMAVTQAKNLNAAMKKLQGPLDELRKQLNVPSGDATALVAKVRDLQKAADAKDPMGMLKVAQAEADKAKTELAQARDQLKQVRTPQQMIDAWMLLLQARTQKNVTAAVQDADRVLNDPASSADARARATYVKGLAARNTGKYDDARTFLAEALKQGKKGAWLTPAQRILNELTDPALFYLPQITDHQANGRYTQAVNTLIQAELAFPKDKGKWLALRSLVHLDQARDEAKGKPLTPGDAGVDKARADAQEAIKAGAAGEGHFALGRLEEELGNLAQARENYQAALKAHPEQDLLGNRCRVALARVLLKLSPAGITATDAPGQDTDVLAALCRAEQGSEPLAALMLLVGLVAQAGAPPAAGTPEAAEAQKLADEILASKDADHMARAQAYAIKGQYNQALLSYVEGLRAANRRDLAEGLLQIVKAAPTFKRPESPDAVNVLAAEEAYAKGLLRYWERRYFDAEKSFQDAVAQDGQDARYYYFLGLSRLALGRMNEAQKDFEAAYKLEQQNRPDMATVNAALERVQGQPRQIMNAFRK